jgi:hypothetical protein
MPSPRQRIWLIAITTGLLLLAGVAGLGQVTADQGPVDYDLPGRFMLPWACGEANRITWLPNDHWAHGKATGLAYDFGLPEGTPVFAPAAGTAYFLCDERPLETNLGNYVDLEVDGGWLVRLAHLRDAQEGERAVRAGELLGYSGSTGVPDAHLHVELLMRDGRRWAAPEAARLTSLFGLPTADLAEGAILVNEGCAAALRADGELYLDAGSDLLALGQPARLLIPIRNVGLEAAAIEQVAVSLRGPGGVLRSIVTTGLWPLAGQARRELAIDVRADEAGEWRVEDLALSVDGVAQRLDAAGGFAVKASSVTLVGLSVPPVLEVGEQVRLEAWLQNASTADVALDGLYVTGLTAGHEAWEAATLQRVTVPAGGFRRLALESASVPYSVGEWQALRVDGLQAGGRLVLARVAQPFRVEGAELAVEYVGPWPAPGRPGLLLMVVNRGTAPIRPERLMLWGEDAEAPHDVSLPGTALGELAPGEARQVILAAEEVGSIDEWTLTAAGAWCGGRYLPVRVPPRLGYAGSPGNPLEDTGDSAAR